MDVHIGGPENGLEDIARAGEAVTELAKALFGVASVVGMFGFVEAG